MGGPFSNSLSVVDVLYCCEVTLSLVRVLKMLSDCQWKSAPDVYVAYTIRSQDTGKLFITELGQFPTCGPPFCHEEGLNTGLASLSFCGDIYLRHNLACRGNGQLAAIVLDTLQLEEKLRVILEKG